MLTREFSTKGKLSADSSHSAEPPDRTQAVPLLILRRAIAVEGIPSSYLSASAAGTGAAGARRKIEIIPKTMRRFISIASPSLPGGMLFL
jgi:hypothetical protein